MEIPLPVTSLIMQSIPSFTAYPTKLFEKDIRIMNRDIATSLPLLDNAELSTAPDLA